MLWCWSTRPSIPTVLTKYLLFWISFMGKCYRFMEQYWKMKLHFEESTQLFKCLCWISPTSRNRRISQWFLTENFSRYGHFIWLSQLSFLFLCFSFFLRLYPFMFWITTQITKALGSMSIRYRYHAIVSDRYLIGVYPRVFTPLWVVIFQNICVGIYYILSIYLDHIQHEIAPSPTVSVKFCNHGRHPIPRPYGRAIECLSWVIQRKMTAIYRECLV